ncbi:hypothetical protein NliqN6_5444 [Naganishia liquefaciens]|uniref:Gfo/Idh/MocA family oxidoreductase n=1 Tax=Naganishia liquefaciens TaxID=104408 RepID=A0A8H3TXR7_9TREE|nr:hypothetical protein NliqN6_5444 [Naganishia liquefaciens]
MSQKLNVALLGAGIFATEAHIPAILKASDTINLVAIYSRSASSVETLVTSRALDSLSSEARDKIAQYSGEEGLEELLKRDDVHAVIVALPISKQPEIIRKSLQAGKHVLSEKPIAKDLKTAHELLDAYEKEFAPKGLTWRVAENWAHEPGILRAAEIIANGQGPLGPVLFYDLKMIIYVASGKKYHATEWRNVPDYQGGFLLDGCVHAAAGLRTVVGDAKPSQVVAFKSLNRTHVGPHDTIVAIGSNPSLTTSPHGPDFPQPTVAPQGIGKSMPTGTITFSFANPRTPDFKRPSLAITCVNGTLCLQGGQQWTVRVESEDESVVRAFGAAADEQGETFPSTGVVEEVAQFARAVLGQGKEVNRAEPRGALWDLGLLEGCLTSDGKVVDLTKLV